MWNIRWTLKLYQMIWKSYAKKWRCIVRLYQGSNIVIDNINLAMCRPYKDFGQGFYLTDIEEQAEKMAIRVARIYGEKPIVNIYEIEDNFKDLFQT